MKKLNASICIAAAIMLLGACNTKVENSQDSQATSVQQVKGKVLTSVAHGGYFALDGSTTINPSIADIKATQRFYMKKLGLKLTSKGGTESDTQIIANSKKIISKLEELEPSKQARYRMINAAILSHYIKNHAQDGAAEGLLTAEQKLGTTVDNVEDYRDLCVKNDVPVPDRVPIAEEWSLSEFPGWKDRGYLETDFLAISNRVQLLTYESEDPAGVCMALPRWNGPEGDEEALAIGLICFGYNSNKACFFDIEGVPRNEEVVDIDRFWGAKGIKDNQNQGGICTDCHAGENPFVIHPEDPAFKQIIDQGVRVTAGAFYDPIVWPDWPQNLYMIRNLPPLAQNGAPEERCDACHIAGNAAFPDVTQGNLVRYCDVILTRAVSSVNPLRTMPPLAFGVSSNVLTPESNLPAGVDFPDRNELRDWDARFRSHRQWLLNACSSSSSGGQVTEDIPQENDPQVLSPPIVSSPIYQCSSSIHVGSLVLGATVELFIGGSSVGSKVVDSPSGVTFQLSNPVQSNGMDVVARQTLSGASSESAPVITRDYQQDYPNGLPTPTFRPDEHYECASKVTVLHLPGSRLRVEIKDNGGNNAGRNSIGGGSGWTVAVPAARAFKLGDQVRVRQSLCGDDSQWSDYSDILPAPSSLPRVQFDPEAPFVGQEFTDLLSLVPGVNVEVSKVKSSNNQILSSANTGSWPFTKLADFKVGANLGPIERNQKLKGRQKLCSIDSPENETPESLECEQMPAPRIATPIKGNTFVLVTESIPGARIQVWDSSGEIGDGSGNVIALSRALQEGETILVMQSIGGLANEEICRSPKGYSVIVRPSTYNNGDPVD